MSSPAAYWRRREAELEARIRELEAALRGLLSLEWSKIVVPDALVAADKLDEARRALSTKEPSE